jgi:hypothetical protein
MLTIGVEPLPVPGTCHEIVNNIDVIAGSNIYLNILRHH